MSNVDWKCNLTLNNFYIERIDHTFWSTSTPCTTHYFGNEDIMISCIVDGPEQKWKRRLFAHWWKNFQGENERTWSIGYHQNWFRHCCGKRPCIVTTELIWRLSQKDWNFRKASVCMRNQFEYKRNNYNCIHATFTSKRLNRICLVLSGSIEETLELRQQMVLVVA